MGKVNSRKRGTKWEYYFESAKVDGQRSRISDGGYRTQKEALAAGTKALDEYNRAGLHFVPSEISFSDYLDFWMKEYCLVNLGAETVKNYRKKIKKHIKPALGKYKLKALTAAVLQSLLNDMFNQGYSRNTLAVIKGILSGSLRYAVEPAHFIKDSPMIYVKLPSTRAKAKTETRSAPHIYIPPEKVIEIFTRFPEGTSTYIPMQFAYRGGTRPGESFAFSWDDIYFDKFSIDINKQVQWDETNKVWYLCDPKYESFRVIKINSDFMELLKRTKEQQEKDREYYGDSYIRNFVNSKNQLNTSGDGREVRFVCVRSDGSFIAPRTMQHTSSVIHHQMNYPEFDLHSFRVTHATMLAEKNAPPKYVMKRLGHKNLKVTMEIYQRITQNMEEQGDEILEDFL